MQIRTEKGSPEYLDACEQALRCSALGENYFSAPGSARKAVLEGLDRGTLYVALTEGQCVGFFFYMPRGAFHAFPYLHILAVKAEYRGRGIGKALLEDFERMAFEISDKVFLVVADFNPSAKRFYEAHGYSQAGEIPGLYRPGITEYLMMKTKSGR